MDTPADPGGPKADPGGQDGTVPTTAEVNMQGDTGGASENATEKLAAGMQQNSRGANGTHEHPDHINGEITRPQWPVRGESCKAENETSSDNSTKPLDDGVAPGSEAPGPPEATVERATDETIDKNSDDASNTHSDEPPPKKQKTECNSAVADEGADAMDVDDARTVGDGTAEGGKEEPPTPQDTSDAEPTIDSAEISANKMQEAPTAETTEKTPIESSASLVEDEQTEKRSTDKDTSEVQTSKPLEASKDLDVEGMESSDTPTDVVTAESAKKIMESLVKTAMASDSPPGSTTEVVEVSQSAKKIDLEPAVTLGAPQESEVEAMGSGGTPEETPAIQNTTEILNPPSNVKDENAEPSDLPKDTPSDTIEVSDCKETAAAGPKDLLDTSKEDQAVSLEVSKAGDITQPEAGGESSQPVEGDPSVKEASAAHDEPLGPADSTTAIPKGSGNETPPASATDVMVEIDNPGTATEGGANAIELDETDGQPAAVETTDLQPEVTDIATCQPQDKAIDMETDRAEEPKAPLRGESTQVVDSTNEPKNAEEPSELPQNESETAAGSSDPDEQDTSKEAEPSIPQNESSEGIDEPMSAADPMNVEETLGESKEMASLHGRSKQVDPRVIEVRRQIQIACRDNKLEFAMTVFGEAVANNTRLEAQSFYNLLNLCDGLERSVHVGTPKGEGGPTTKVLPVGDSTIDNQKRQEFAFRIKDHMAQLNLPLNEAAYTAVVKVLVRNKEYTKAEEILDESASVQQCKPKLRLYSSLLSAYCEEREMILTLKCWLRISKQKLDLTEREFVSLMKCAIATGDVPVFERVLSDIAETVPVPSKDAVGAILEWYDSPHAVIHQEAIRIPKHADETEVKSLLDAIHIDEGERPPSMGPVQDAKGWNTSSSVSIDRKTGTFKGGCLGGCSMKQAPLSDRALEEMTAMNETIVLAGQVEGNKSQFQGGRKGKIRNDFDPQERKARWTEFTNFLDSTGPIDVVIDAANVGYYKQNFASAPRHVDYEQIDWVARHFIGMGKKVLLFLHQRHFSSKLMPEKYIPLQQGWEQKGILYKTPAGMNDDWFWLHAALKYKALVLTNDEMRDHHFQMLAPQTFLRWKERHQIHFSFGDWEPSNPDGPNNDRRGRKVELEFPAVYSRRVQRVENGLAVPLIKRGDENRFLDGTHVAEKDEPLEETYLCIRSMQ